MTMSLFLIAAMSEVCGWCSVAFVEILGTFQLQHRIPNRPPIIDYVIQPAQFHALWGSLLSCDINTSY